MQNNMKFQKGISMSLKLSKCISTIEEFSPLKFEDLK